MQKNLTLDTLSNTIADVKGTVFFLVEHAFSAPSLVGWATERVMACNEILYQISPWSTHWSPNCTNATWSLQVCCLPALVTCTGANPVLVVCSGMLLCAQHSTSVSGRQPAADIRSCRRQRSADTTTLLVPPT